MAPSTGGVTISQAAAFAGVTVKTVRHYADAEQFAAALTDVERRLTERIADLTARRDTLRQLADGDRLPLPDRARTLLDRLTDLGFDPDYVAGQREALVLARALAPEFLDIFVTQLEHRLDDPEFVDLTKRGWDARSWDPDDPRIDELASALADNLLNNSVHLAVPTDFQPPPDAATHYGLINHHREDHAPTTWARLNALVEAELRAAGVPIPHE